MKILHCADLHLDSKMETNLSTEDAKKRRYEILDTFEKMIDYAVEKQISVVIIAGDMFDTAQNKQKIIKNRVLDKIKNTPEVDFLYLQGNHDKDDFFKELEERPNNLRLFTNHWTSYKYGNVVISGIEFEEKDNSNIYTGLTLDENTYNIVVLHGQVSKYGNEMKGGTIYLSALQNRYIDYLALGHIHQYRFEKLDYRGNYCYPGCLEGRGFDECGEKGFVVLDTQNTEEPVEFISLSKRTIHETRVDITGLTSSDDIVKKVDSAISQIGESDIVKIILCGEILEETEIDRDYMEHRYENRFFYSKVVDETSLYIDFSKYENDISFKGEFMRKVKNLEISDEEKNQVIMMGINTITGGDK